MGTVRYLAPDTDAYVASVQRHAGEFEAHTGHRLEVRILASDEYFSNRIGFLLIGDDAADVFMSGPVLLWEHVDAGLVEPLDEHLASADGDFDLADFLRRLLEVNRWTGQAGDPLGTGPLLEIPVNCESYNLAFTGGQLRGLASVAAASGTRCTRGSRPSCGAAAGATSTPTDAPRSPTPTQSP